GGRSSRERARQWHRRAAPTPRSVDPAPAHHDRFRCRPCALPTLVLLCIELRAVEDGMHIDKDLVAASATPLVLAILAESESYGYAILKQVRALSGGELEWTDGMLYPLLHRLRRLGYVTTEWRMP